MRTMTLTAALAAAFLLAPPSSEAMTAAPAPQAALAQATAGEGLVQRAGSRERRHFDRHSRRWHRWHRHRGPHFGIYIGPRYGYSYRYRRGCGWLRARAIHTGSRYWWRRYYQCRSYRY